VTVHFCRTCSVNVAHLSIAISTGVLKYFDDMMMSRGLFGAGSKDEVTCRSCCGKNRFASRWSETAPGTDVLYIVARVRRKQVPCCPSVHHVVEVGDAFAQPQPTSAVAQANFIPASFQQQQQQQQQQQHKTWRRRRLIIDCASELARTTVSKICMQLSCG
jgi:hypothetical protein